MPTPAIEYHLFHDGALSENKNKKFSVSFMEVVSV